MRILYLAPANSPHSERWIRWFANAGHQVTWVSAHPPLFDAPAGTRMITLRQGRRTPFRWIRWLRQVHREVRIANPDVVHVHSLGTYALLALGVPRVVHLVLTPWGSDLVTDLNSPWRKAIVRRAVRHGALYTCDAMHMKTRLVALGANPSRVHLINFGIDTPRFAKAFTNRQQRWDAIEGANQPLRIVSLRNLDPVYDHPTILRAVARLAKMQLPLSVKMYGFGPELDRLQAMAQELGINDRVTFCGRYTPSMLPDILNEADLYVSTSLSDAGIASSTAEAMAAGLPVVISNSGENTEWITDMVNGRLFAVGDDETLANIIATCCANRSQLRRWGDAGRTTIIERNDYATEMQKMAKLYSRLAR